MAVLDLSDAVLATLKSLLEDAEIVKIIKDKLIVINDCVSFKELTTEEYKKLDKWINKGE